MGVINQTVNRQLASGADTKVEVDMVAYNAPVPGSSKINVEVTGVSHAKVLWSERSSDINDVQTIDIADKLPPLNTPPVAVIVDDAGLVTLQTFEITFDGQGSFDTDGTITKFAWTFGDGAAADGSVVKHKYSLPGTYSRAQGDGRPRRDGECHADCRGCLKPTSCSKAVCLSRHGAGCIHRKGHDGGMISWGRGNPP